MADKGDLIATDAGAALIHVPPPAELDAAELKGPVPLDAVSLERAASSDGDLELFGQSRALDAIRLAIGIDAAGYNVFVSGLRSRHERESVLRLLSENADARRLGVRKQFSKSRISGRDLPAAGPGGRAARADDGADRLGARAVAESVSARGLRSGARRVARQ